MPSPDDPNLEPSPRPSDLHLPDELGNRLSAMHDAQLFVPPDIDEAIRTQARDHFGVAPQKNHRTWLRLAAPLAAAASIALGVWVVWPSVTSPVTDSSIVIAGDIDQNGSVNILDAFALARHIDAGQPTPADWDMNDDGQVDHADISAITTIAVSLSGGSNPEGNPGAGGTIPGAEGGGASS